MATWPDKVPPTGCIGLVCRNANDTTASWSTVEGTLMAHCSYCDISTIHAVAAASILKVPSTVLLVAVP